MLLLLQPLCVVKWSNHECLLRVFEGGGGGCLIHLLLHRWLWTLEKMVDILWTRSSSGWWVMLNSKPFKIKESHESLVRHWLWNESWFNAKSYYLELVVLHPSMLESEKCLSEVNFWCSSILDARYFNARCKRAFENRQILAKIMHFQSNTRAKARSCRIF